MTCLGLLRDGVDISIIVGRMEVVEGVGLWNGSPQAIYRVQNAASGYQCGAAAEEARVCSIYKVHVGISGGFKIQ